MTVRYARSITSTLGVFLIFDVGIRGIKTLFSTPVDTASIRDATVRYVNLAREREFDRRRSRKEAHKLGNLYKKEHAYDLAEYYYDVAGNLTERKKRKLHEKSAGELLRLARRETEAKKKQLVLQSIITMYPDTKSGERAVEELAELRENNDVLFILEYKDFKQYPHLRDITGILPQLFDGIQSNGELDDNGVRVMEDHTIAFTDQNTDTEIHLTPAEKDFEQLKQFWYETALHQRSHDAAQEALLRRKFPLEIVGSVGSDGFDISPRLLPLSNDPSLKLFR
jgi:hypothetical protein